MGATGVIETVAVGTATHVLTSNGVGVAPTFQAAAGGGLSWGDSITAGSGSGITVDAESNDLVCVELKGDGFATNPMLKLWSDAASSSDKVLSVGNETSYQENSFFRATGALFMGTTTTAQATGSVQLQIGSSAADTNAVPSTQLTAFENSQRYNDNVGVTATHANAQTKIYRRVRTSHASSNVTVSGALLWLESQHVQTSGTCVVSGDTVRILHDTSVTGEIFNITDSSSTDICKLGGDGVWRMGSSAVHSGTNMMQVKTATAPTGATADNVVFYSSDDAAGHTVPSFYCEGTNVIATGQADSASSVRVKMRINGTVVTLLAI